ncbi:uncharacterized protein GGS22DRAFT_163408 [Annulohypoxylon maeteangense]|uniref:uncharacterized protein n=1 Tax=Annulohypoxylon maeteangense TaxID=1927788 RepID=UPI00200741DE|nr:uncharacterized protein GGS22DRAFT_163408 [Annulohypoxylon maeteangense]KAI0885310.1 hypothetical protein GGS22DRAFT_163408 [Annulohypoxylon maeteangense]
MDMHEEPPLSWPGDSSSEYSSDDDNDTPASQNQETSASPLIEPTEAMVEDEFAGVDQATESTIIHAREYQLEMFEDSLRRNLIVTMETGTGKTQVAVLRIQAELERSPPDKIIWFLAPTVALCEQQAKVLRSQMPSVQIKFLSGADGIDTWTDDRTWDDYLKNARVVVSTYQVLLDATSHAFVRIDRLSLIVLDEAHNCVGKHPGSKFMARYHARKAVGLPVPSILGLTASPIMNSKLEALEIIEKTLDSVCKSPTIHREELLSIVKRPVMRYIFYSQTDDILQTRMMQSLAEVYLNMDIYRDPYIVRLREEGSERSIVALKKALGKRSTYVFDQMKYLWRKSSEIQKELGSWAADYFIFASISSFLKSVKENDTWFREWMIEEKQYLSEALEKVNISRPPPLEDNIPAIDVSNKVAALIQELSCAADGTIGIIFVREVATVSVLTHMLSVHPSIKNRFRIGAMIGTSNHAGRKRDIGTLNKNDGYQDLEKFQDGTLNLLIATSVLEEGIDVPACNMVICFDKPDNLKGFIQRRGRARMRESKLILLLDNPTRQVDEWTALEEEMKKRYEEDVRQIQELVELEESEQTEIEPLYIPETGARIDFDQAKSHLEHFCTQLSTRQYADSRPYYIFKRSENSLTQFRKVTATVVLPMSVRIPELRRIESSGCWFSEKNASKDAALQAYIAIHKAGLLNNNLLPLNHEFLSSYDTRAGMAEVHERWSPWTQVAHAWGQQNDIYQRRLRLINQHGGIICEFDASLPVPFSGAPDFDVFWDKSNAWRVEMGEMKIIPACDLRADQSPALMNLAYGHRKFDVRESTQILHIRSLTQDIPFQQLSGQKCVEEAYLDDTVLIRYNNGIPYILKAWLPVLDIDTPVKGMLQGQPLDIPWLMLEKFSRRKNFLHPVVGEATSSKPAQFVVPAHLCQMDSIHVSNVYFGALIPSIIHKIEIHLVANELCNTLLKDVEYSDISLVSIAINSPGTGEGTNYERIEFLGDTILKLFTTATVTANNPNFPEGYLDGIKMSIVSNARLCRSAVETGLDKFILKRGFKGKKWQPLYVEDLVKTDINTGEKRPMSTKTLADVVEALIGAAYIDGGLSLTKALTCIRIFIPNVEWRSLDSARTALFNQTSLSTELVAPLVPLEELIGYSFKNKNLLVEAATHSSFGFVNSTGSSMERLEFLGDAILDYVVTSAIWDYERDMDQREMHLFRTASVNADLLGFLGMEWTISQETTEIAEDKTIIKKQVDIPFWKFMRHSSRDMANRQQNTEKRYMSEKEPILDAIKNSKGYPWVELAHLDIPKVFSDFFESVLGAVWVDSGSMDMCVQFAERAGILPYLRRMFTDEVDVLHPKNHLGILAGKYLKTVEYRNESQKMDDGSKELSCKIFINGEVIVEVGGGVNPEEIQTKAAHMAYKILKAREDNGELIRDTGEDVVMTT